MDITQRLRSLGVAPCSDTFEARFEVLQPARGSIAAPARGAGPPPLVSCLMVTRGDLGLMRHALDCYQRQTWTNRELVVVTAEGDPRAIQALLAEVGVRQAVLASVGAGLTLGDLRNLAVARARGEILVQWDDDDLSDPGRIATAVAVLRASGASAAFLDRWLTWWPARELAAISARRICEGTMALWRDGARTYPAAAKAEDSDLLRRLQRDEPIALIDAPLQYVYVVTGRNTSGDAHFEAEIARAEHVFESQDYRDLLDLLAQRLPVAAYAAHLAGSAGSE